MNVHRHRPSRGLALSGILLVLSACGGGGGSDGGGTKPPAGLPDSALQAAAAADLRSFSFPATGKMELRWTDRLVIETGFRIERRVGGAWQEVGTVPAGSSPEGALSWSGPLDNAETSYRVLALFAQGQTLPLSVAGDRTEVAAGVPAATASVSLSKAEPLQGTVDLLPSGLPSWKRVSYEIDAGVSGTVEIVPELGYLGRWDTLPLSNGPHTVKALVEYAPNAFVELRRTVTTQNPDVVIQLTPYGGTGVTARVINRVSDVPPALGLQVDGKDAGAVLAAPNTTVCPPGKPCYPAYVFSVPIENYGYGAHTMTVTTRGQPGGKVYTASMDAFFNASPVLAVEEPRTGTILSDTLRISGAATDDSGQLSGDVFLDDVRIGTLGTGHFQLARDVRSLTPGLHTVRVQVSDPRNLQESILRSVVIQPVSSDRFEPVERPQEVLAESSTRWLFQDAGGRILARARDGQTADRVLPTDGLGQASRWMAAGDQWVGVFGKQMLLWKADGSRVTLASLPDGMDSAFGVADASSTHVAWVETGPTPVVRVLELATMSRLTLVMPTGFQPANQWTFLLSANGQALALTLQKVDEAGKPLDDWRLYSHALKSGTFTALVSGFKGAPRSDGVQLAWLQKVSDDPTVDWELWTAPLDASAKPVRMSTRIKADADSSSFSVGNGWVRWVEYAKGTFVSRIGQTTPSLALPGIDSVSGLAPEGVFYVLEGRTYYWTPQGGARVVLQAPAAVISQYGVLYLSAGEQWYRLVLGGNLP